MQGNAFYFIRPHVALHIRLTLLSLTRSVLTVPGTELRPGSPLDIEEEGADIRITRTLSSLFRVLGWGLPFTELRSMFDHLRLFAHCVVEFHTIRLVVASALRLSLFPFI